MIMNPKLNVVSKQMWIERSVNINIPLIKASIENC